jgi:putative inorganic carbon (HCO3(-)) transporter
VWRLILGAYTLLAVAMIWFSGSRGAWIGLVAAAVVMAGLILPAKFPEMSRRLWPLGAGAIVLIGLIVGLIVMLRPDPGRTVIYEDAFNRFLSAPLTGHGLFTYKIYVPEPVELRMHIHAHNIFLQIAVELGLIGLVALVVSMYLAARSAWLNWREARGPDAWVMVGVIGALVGFTVHQLLDFPVLMPCIAIMLVVCLVIATTGVSPQPVKARPAWQLTAIVLLAVVIIGVGFYINANQPQLLLIAVNYYP